jgi:hypothetical protein
LKRLSKKKVSKKLKIAHCQLLTAVKLEEEKRLHLLNEANAKVLLDFEIGNNREVEHAEVMLEDIEGSILLAVCPLGIGVEIRITHFFTLTVSFSKLISKSFIPHYLLM